MIAAKKSGFSKFSLLAVKEGLYISENGCLIRKIYPLAALHQHLLRQLLWNINDYLDDGVPSI